LLAIKKATQTDSAITLKVSDFAPSRRTWAWHVFTWHSKSLPKVRRLRA
jgi:hypothetical protein